MTIEHMSVAVVESIQIAHIDYGQERAYHLEKLDRHLKNLASCKTTIFMVFIVILFPYFYNACKVYRYA
jgi:hypothetical protein